MVAKQKKNSLNSSNLIESVIKIAISSLIYIQVLPVSAQQIRPISFIESCQQRNSLPIDTRESINLLLKATETKNCQAADRRLRSNTLVRLRNSNISDLKPLAKLLAGFSNLKYMDLSNNNIKDLKPLAILINLRSINLDENDISDLKPLAKLNKLESISIYKNQVSDLKPLTKLSNLIVLNLSYNEIRSVKALAGLSNLSRLYICGNKIDDVKSIHDLINLREINICGKSKQDLYESGRYIIESIKNDTRIDHDRGKPFPENVEQLNMEIKNGYKTQKYFIYSFKSSDYLGTLLIAKTSGGKSYLSLFTLTGMGERKVMLSETCVSNRPNQTLLPDTTFQQNKDGVPLCPRGWSELVPLFITGV